MERYFLVMYQYIKPFSGVVEFGNVALSKQGGLNHEQFCDRYKKVHGCQQVGILFFREMTEQEFEDFTRKA